MQVEVIYWRDIPAQCTARIGRKRQGMPLSERFERAIDRCAMKVGAKDSDAYLREWRRVALSPEDAGEGEAKEVLERVSARLEAEYDNARLRSLIERDGFESPQSSSS